VSFEQKRISVGSIIFLFRFSRKGKRKGARFLGLEIAGYSKDLLFSFQEHISQALRQNSSCQGVCGLFSFRIGVLSYWFDAWVIFQHPSIDFRRLGASSTRHHPLPALATSGDILRSSTVVHCHR
jgi:hypothetical protein